MPICKNVILLNLDESKMGYVLELEKIFRNLKRAWVDLRNIWGPEEEKMQTEIKEKLKDNLAQFAEIRKENIMQETLQESKKTNRKSTVVIIITLVSLAAAIVIPLILFFV